MLEIPTKEQEDEIVELLLGQFDFDQALKIIVDAKIGSYQSRSINSMRAEAERFIREVAEARRRGDHVIRMSSGGLVVRWVPSAGICLALEPVGASDSSYKASSTSYSRQIVELHKLVGTYMYLTCTDPRIRAAAAMIDMPLYPNGLCHPNEKET